MKRKINVKKIELVSLVLLALIFLGLILVSSNTDSLEISYDLSEEVRISSSAGFGSQVTIGSVSVKNPDFFPKKVVLERWVLCNINQSAQQSFVEVMYSDAELEYFSRFLEEDSKRQYSFEIAGSSQREQEIGIFVNTHKFEEENIPKIGNEVYLLYVFPHEEYLFYSNGCDSLLNQEPLNTITLRFEE